MSPKEPAEAAEPGFDERLSSLEALVSELLETLRAVMLLTGSRTVDELRQAPRTLGPHLSGWLARAEG